MRALVVYESMFGNTERIAYAIARGLATEMTTETVEVSHAPADPTRDIDLLVIGGPTHGLGLSRPATRAKAAVHAGGVITSDGIGLREWLSVITPRLGSPRVAIFDTKFGWPRLPGSAARRARARLRRLGFAGPIPMATFRVRATIGPLLDGEIDRARRWGHWLGGQCRQLSPGAERFSENGKSATPRRWTCMTAATTPSRPRPPRPTRSLPNRPAAPTPTRSPGRRWTTR
jgi:hypothetical protein